MTINELRESVANLRNKLNTAVSDGVRLAQKDGVTIDELNKSSEAVRLIRAQLDTVTTALEEQEKATAPRETPKGGTSVGGVLASGHRARLQSPEYMRAWGRAMSTNLTPRLPCPNDDMKVLYDALTEVGGTPEGEDGGFLVPDDVDNTIHEQLREFGSMRELVTVETTRTIKGSRVGDNAPTKGLVALDAEGDEIDDSDDQPSFVKIPYSLGKYALIIDVSRDLLKDNVANLAAYISRWFARKQVITENKLIIAKLNLLTPSNITPADDVDAIRKVRSLLNLSLDPAISARATIITNQSGLDYLDSIVDGNGRPLLTQDPVSGVPMILKTRPVKVYSDAQMPNRVVSTTGVTKGTYFPLYVGDGKLYATLFEREGLELASTDVGGTAFARDMTSFRGITRLGASVFDSAAMVRREIFIAD